MKLQPRFFMLMMYTAFISFVCISSCTSTKQTMEVRGASESETKQAIESDKWIFIASQAIPQRGRTSILNTRYSVDLKNDTLTSGLPYFGRAYTAPIGESRSPLDFRSTDFSINKKEVKEGRWNIIINPKDNKEVQSYTFNLFSNGSAQLSVQLTSRSPISFSGNVMPVK